MSNNDHDPDRPKRVALYVVAVAAMLAGFAEGVVSHGAHGRLVGVIGFGLLYYATKAGGGA